jgi:ankyrin repeat protein
MKRKMVFVVFAFLLVLQAQAVFAADYDADFKKELDRNNIQNIERLLSRRAGQMDLADCMYYTIKNKTDCLDVLRLLLRYGADVNSRMRAGYPLENAILEKRSLSVIQFLLDSGANPNLRYNSPIVPLALAYHYGNMTLVNLLLDKGAKGELLLPMLGNRGDNDFIKSLITRGVQVRSNEGAVALRNAAENDKFDTVKLLVANGVNVNARDEDGSTALSLAYDKGNIDIYDYLKANGARDFEPRQVTQQPTQPAAPAQSTTNVYVQPSAPAPAPAQSAPATPTLQTGTYAASGTNMTMNFRAGIVTVSFNYRAIWMGTYRINGNQIVFSVSRVVNDDYNSLLGKIFAYTITSSTSFSGSGETWVQTSVY